MEKVHIIPYIILRYASLLIAVIWLVRICSSLLNATIAVQLQSFRRAHDCGCDVFLGLVRLVFQKPHSAILKPIGWGLLIGSANCCFHCFPAWVDEPILQWITDCGYTTWWNVQGATFGKEYLVCVKQLWVYCTSKPITLRRWGPSLLTEKNCVAFKPKTYHTWKVIGTTLMGSIKCQWKSFITSFYRTSTFSWPYFCKEQPTQVEFST